MKLLEYAAVIIAAAFAYVLFSFGIRADRFNRAGSRNLFMSSLMLMLGLLSYSGPADASHEAQALTGKQPPAAENTRVSVSELFDTAEWKQFRDFWKKLDAISPKDGKYEESLPLQECNELRKELNEKVAGLNSLDRKMISNKEIELLRQLCYERIDGYGCYRDFTMMSRMMPPPSDYVKKQLVVDMENKIDVLIKLKNSGKVSEEEIKKALSNIQDDVEAVSALEIISSKYFWRSHRFEEPSLFDGNARRAIDESMKSLEEDHSVYIGKLKARSDMTPDERMSFENIERQYLETKKAVNQLKAVMPRLDEMIADLENG